MNVFFLFFFVAVVTCTQLIVQKYGTDFLQNPLFLWFPSPNNLAKPINPNKQILLP